MATPRLDDAATDCHNVPLIYGAIAEHTAALSSLYRYWYVQLYRDANNADDAARPPPTWSTRDFNVVKRFMSDVGQHFHDLWSERVAVSAG